MQVILKSDVPNLGRAGDVKNVKDGFARNYLIPKKLVMPATARSTKEREFLAKVQESKIRKRKKTAEETAAAVNGKEVTITMKVGEGKLFGSVTNIAIQKELEKLGFLLDKRVIELDDPIKTLGKFDIPLRLYESVSCEIKLTVQDEDGNIELKEIKEEEAKAEAVENPNFEPLESETELEDDEDQAPITE